MAKVHEYPVSVRWEGARTGQGSVTSDRSQIASPISVPPEFGGDGKPGTNPEELLTSAIAACYSITFGIIAANRKLEVVSFEASAVGEVEEQGPQFTYKKIVIRPKITLAATADDAALKLAEDIAHKADSYCIVTNAVRGKVEIVLEPTVGRA